ncbi:MAG: hypothetical protein IMZ54_06720 [Acidobacteria bacterium]|nr:hypothetical protein [Acidobacteriota bacterium]
MSAEKPAGKRNGKCSRCGSTFLVFRKWQKFCSSKCRKNDWLEKNSLPSAIAALKKEWAETKREWAEVKAALGIKKGE